MFKIIVLNLKVQTDLKIGKPVIPGIDFTTALESIIGLPPDHLFDIETIDGRLYRAKTLQNGGFEILIEMNSEPVEKRESGLIDLGPSNYEIY